MAISDEARAFLMSRRAQVTPADVGLPPGQKRRVAGLRRSEVAMLAGISVEYYTRLERGAIGGASPEILESLGRALNLNDAERAHLAHLAAAASASPRQRRARRAVVLHESLQWALDAVTAAPAFVRNGRMDLLAANPLARAFYAEVYAMGEATPNLARFTFLSAAAHDFHPDWEAAADVVVSILRTEAGRDPHNPAMHELIGELSTLSPEFRQRWGTHNVRHHGTGFKTFHHGAVGEMTLAFEGLEMAAAPGLTLTIYTAEPGSVSHERLALLGSWGATQGAANVGVHVAPHEPRLPSSRLHPES